MTDSNRQCSAGDRQRAFRRYGQLAITTLHDPQTELPCAHDEAGTATTAPMAVNHKPRPMTRTR